MVLLGDVRDYPELILEVTGGHLGGKIGGNSRLTGLFAFSKLSGNASGGIFRPF